MRTRPSWIALLLFSMLAMLARGELEVRAAGKDGAAQQGSIVPWHLQAAKLSYDSRSEVYTAEGSVRLTSGDWLISADRIRLDSRNMEAVLEGNVRLQQGDNWLEGERAIIHLDSETGSIEEARGFAARNHFYFSGHLIEKVGDKKYHLEKATLTSCDGDHPSWRFRGRDVFVQTDGSSTAKHVRFYIGKVPVFYTPYVSYPAGKDRQTGLLPPRLADSSLLGKEFDLPFFWAISDSADATYYAHYMSKRGLMSGGEFRYVRSARSQGIMRFDYLNDQEKPKNLRNKGFREVAPGLDGNYRRRWWWRSKQDASLPWGINGKMDLDFASDVDYLREFKTGFSSYKVSSKIFEDTFHRDIVSDKNSIIRESFLLMNKTWTSAALNGQLNYNQNLNDNEDKYTLQQFPLLTFQADRQHLFSTPLFYQAEASYVNYWRQKGTRGHRFDLAPRLSWPLYWERYLEVEPSVSWQETIYLIDRFDESEDSKVTESTLQSRQLVNARLKTSTDISRVFDTGLLGWSKLRHTFRPEIVYDYIPPVNQKDLPLFDATDRISKRNRLTYSVTNFFVARMPGKKPGETVFKDVGRLKLAQSYSFVRPQKGVVPEVRERRRLSNLFAQLDLTPGGYLENLTYIGEWSPHDGDFKRHELLSTLADERGDKLEVNYRRILDKDGHVFVHQIYGKMLVQLWDGLSFSIASNYSFDRKENLQTEYLVRLQRQCWGISLGYVDEPNNSRVLLGFSLGGIGELHTPAIGLGD
ncbi:MAG: LPS-assembly protein LptD [Deltaproteobacteria bacterium]|nr:LPS-assembly protein LptD [Deltaproteobacteria bacterium]MBW2069969.1 LPS-assembly protein LptD [Deltaproteobacteria bacterium]